MANERTCLACGKKYNFCPKCAAARVKPWQVTFDSEACKEVFNIVSAYNMSLVDLNDVKAVLDKYNIADVSVYKDTIRDVLMKAKQTNTSEKVDIELKAKKEHFALKSKEISK